MVSKILFASINGAFIINNLEMLSKALCVIVILVICINIYIIEGVMVLWIKTQSENSDESSYVIQGIKLKSYDLVYIS